MKRTARTVALVLPLALAAAGCGGRETADDTETSAVPDTGAMGGLSREEIARRAEAMPPEVAESLGIVDTTIRVESLQRPDSFPPYGPVPGTAPPVPVDSTRQR